MDKLQEVRAKVIEAVPEIDQTKRCSFCDGKGTYLSGHTCWYCAGTGKIAVFRPITLADVLRAIGRFASGGPIEYGVRAFDGQFMNMFDRGRWAMDGRQIAWNLALPLDEQEPEVIEFLHKILTHQP